jgi:uncharacterized protein (TIGR00730 family)
MAKRSLCVFTGSHPGHHEKFRAAAAALGEAMARREVGLVYGGGNCGLMGVVADAVLAGGGRVVGVIPHALLEREVAHRGLTELIVTPDMHSRKARMVGLADAFVALPGGYGTLDELFEVVTWSQLGIHKKPIGLLDVDGFWDGLVTFLAQVRTEGFIPAGALALPRETDPCRILDVLLP